MRTPSKLKSRTTRQLPAQERALKHEPAAARLLKLLGLLRDRNEPPKH